MATALVTGAAGHLGANIVRALLDAGHKVRALVHRDRRALAGLPLTLVEGDITDAASLEAAVAGCDWVFHCAVRIQLDDRDLAGLHAVNVGGTCKLLDACRSEAVRRLIYLSSIEALDPEPAEEPVDESRPLAARPLMPYAASKVAAERAVRAAIDQGLDAIILYPTAMIGPEDHHPSHAGRFLLDLAQGSLPALVTGGFDWVDVRDVAASAVRAAEVAAAGDRFLLSGRWAAAAEIADLVCARSGVNRPPVLPRALAWLGLPFSAAWCALTGAEPRFSRGSLSALAHYRVVDHGHGARELDHAPRDLEVTLRETTDWLLAHHGPGANRDAAA
jgi:nucleoside-diphosphate-sugar epimerase